MKYCHSLTPNTFFTFSKSLLLTQTVFKFLIKKKEKRLSSTKIIPYALKSNILYVTDAVTKATVTGEEKERNKGINNG